MGAVKLKELKKLKVAELKAHLKTRGLDDGGLKDDLVRRLHDAQTADAAGDGDGDVPAEADPPHVMPMTEDATADATEPTATMTEDPPEDAIAAVGEFPPASVDEEELVPASTDSVVTNPKIDRARARLATNDNDVDAWEVLLTEAQAAGVPTARSLFEEIVEKHPTSAKAWKVYAECEIVGDTTTGARDDDAVKSIFSRSLLICPSADLWRSYTRYMVTTNDPTDADGVAAIKAAFEYTLDTIGEDIESGPLWLDYVTFLKMVSPEDVCTDVATEHAESARAQEVRRAYKRAISVPTNSIDALYREYDTFETELDATLAKALLATEKPKVDLVRKILKERKRRSDKLHVGGVLFAPGTVDVKNQKSPEHQSGLWRLLIAWERSNPQQLGADVEHGELYHPQLVTRVNLAYEQALMTCRFCPDVWLEFAGWHESEGRLDEAGAVLQRAKEANPETLLLLFAHADLFEKQNDVENTKSIYEQWLDAYENACLENERAAGGGSNEPTDPTDPEKKPNYLHPTMDDATTLAYVEYMRVCRRVESAQSARKAFMRARKAPGSGRFEIYVASAQLEWRYDKNDKPARNIFELGLKKHILAPKYVKLYADFLVGINDVANARVLFERATSVAIDSAAGKGDLDGNSNTIIPGTNRITGGVLAMTSSEKERRVNILRQMFDMFVHFEHSHGSHETMSSIETRRHVALGSPGGDVNGASAIVTGLMARHSFLTLPPATKEQQTHYVCIGATMPRISGISDTPGTQHKTIPPPVPPPIPPPRPPPLKKGEVSAAAAEAALPKALKGAGNIPKIMPPPPAPGSAAAAAAAALSSLPAELGAFVQRLPSATVVGEAPVHVIDAVMDTLLGYDLSPDGGASTVEQRNEALGVSTDLKSGEKRKSSELSAGQSKNAGPLTAASNKPPVMDVFRMRQAKHQRTDNAEFQ